MLIAMPSHMDLLQRTLRALIQSAPWNAFIRLCELVKTPGNRKRFPYGDWNSSCGLNCHGKSELSTDEAHIYG